MPYFFFSYARYDAEDAFLDTFFKELIIEVGARTGLNDKTSVGFLDRNQPPGVDWASTTGGALASCKVLVPVYSPRYFGSEYCGQEWHAFHARLEEHRAALGVRPACVVPVWWIPPAAELPPTVSWLQDTRDQLFPEYRDEGLRYLMRLSACKPLYEQALTALARKVVDAGKEPARETGVADIARAPNAFATRSAEGPPPARAAARPVPGPRRVRFIVVAAGTERMRPLRSTLDSYGHDWDDWQPYRTETASSLAVRAEIVANGQDMLSSSDPLKDDLLLRIEEARARSELVVLLLDPWAVGLDDHRAILSALDDRRYANTAVVVPWETLTAQQRQAEEMLHDCLANWSYDSPVFRDQAHSLQEFEKVLVEAMTEVRRRVVKQAARVRTVHEPGPSSRPVMTGAGGLAP